VSGTRLWVRCVHGLEDVVEAELAVRLLATAFERRPRSVFCSVTDAGTVADLQTADDALELVGTATGIGPTKRELPRLVDALDSIDAGTCSVGVTASFVGRRTYNRYDIEDTVGEHLAMHLGAAYTSRRGDVRPPPADLDIRVHIEDDVAFVGRRIGDRPLHRRVYKNGSVAGTLHPPVAAALAVLGGLAPGQLVLDPTCGAATTVIEAARWNGSVRSLGLDAAAMMPAVGNVRDSAHPVALVRGDAGSSPLRARSVDLVLTNPPWGRQASALGSLAAGPDRLWSEIARVLRPRGRAVVLAEDDHDPHAARHGLELHARVPLSLMGAHPTIAVYGSPVPPPEAVLRGLLRG
jgi:23S rRNA G2445 N2-methylase RlmL